MKSLEVVRSAVGRPLACLSWLGALLAALPGCSPAGDAENSASTSSALRVGAPGTAKWSATIPLTIVPVGGADLTNGRVLFWSSASRMNFGGSGQTYTTLFDPATKTATEMLVTATGHNMFCPGTANTGRPHHGERRPRQRQDEPFRPGDGIVDHRTGEENPARLQRGLPRLGRFHFSLGGSWSGGQGNKNGEIWTASRGWRALPGVLVAPAITADATGIYRPGTDPKSWRVWRCRFRARASCASRSTCFHRGDARGR